jgi:hypothetical protein
MITPTPRNRSDEIPNDPNQRPIDARRLQQQAQQGAPRQMGGHQDDDEEDLGRDHKGRHIPYPTD